jgi:branched-chain amino acid aminotransferase
MAPAESEEGEKKMEIRFEKTEKLKKKPEDESRLGFGKIFTDYMFVMDYDVEHGWHDARIVPYGPIVLDPSAAIFHYAQEIFEGLKAYRTPDGRAVLFRPDCNAERFQNSADRMGIPPVDEADFVEACSTLVRVEKDWIPHDKGTSLYLRPFIIAMDTGLGVHASKTYRFTIIASPSGAYYEHGLSPVKIYVEDEYIRAAPGLTGFAKCGGNYAASIKSGELAHSLGYDQVLWLDGIHHKYVEEVGSMNIFFMIDGVLYTAPCIGTVLPGVTRRSIITLLKEWGYCVSEERLAVDDVMKAGKEGRLEEVFGSGTAAVISPVGVLTKDGETVTIHQGTIGELSQRLYDTLTGIQNGLIKDTHHWVYPVA